MKRVLVVMSVILASVVVVIGGGVGYYLHLRHPAKHQAAPLSPAQAKNLQVPFPQLTSNLKDDGLIQFTVVLQASDQATKAELVDLQPQIEDLFNLATRQFTSDELRQVSGYTRLKQRIRAGVNRLLPKGSVTAVYLENTLVQ
ncbi:MAG: flagellar basal body-associated FliL family protein [Alicyclobacillus sp.]|nr:flagellar basal body-associated FliL family protein [Alicyclobacillus sp.]